jgi:pyrroloquinoline quinone biosynthesis protein E
MNLRIIHLNIEVTKRCNQRCFYCFNNSGIGSPASEFTADQWLKILRRLKEKGLESIHLTGGEPFAYPHAVQLLAGAHNLGLGTSILSNGFRVKELAHASPKVFRDLTVAQISLDSMNETTHNHRRGYPRAWRDATSAIRALRELQVEVEVSCVVSEANISDLQDVAGYCESNAARLIIRPMLLAGRAAAISQSRHFDVQFETILGALKPRYGTRIVKDRFYYLPDEKHSHPSICPAGIYTVHHDGKLRGLDIQESTLNSVAA